MSAPQEGRLRLTVLGGYLGSGKTTWLRHQLHVGAFGRAHVLVNEAAEVPVDDALLAAADGLTVLAGGSVCGPGQGDLVTALRALCDVRSRVSDPAARLDHVVLETSGLTDPAPIVATLRADPVLVRHIVVTEIVVVVDALHGLPQLRSEPLGRFQVEAADRLILTKTAGANPLALARLQLTLQHLNPGAAISAAELGSELPLPPAPQGASPEVLPPLSEEDGRGPISPTALQIGAGVDWDAFAVWLSALLHARGDDVVRVKGVVRTSAGRLLLQAVRKVVQAPEVLPEQGDGRDDGTIVVIGRGYRAEDLQRSLDYFAGIRPLDARS